MKTVAVIQARMGSTRLPGKALLEIAGMTMLERCVLRTAGASCIDEVIVATTTARQDDVIAGLAAARGWRCWRGSEADVLDRYHGAARDADADVVIRITSDCPLIDPSIIDQVHATRTEQRADYCANVLPPRSFPRGLDTECFTFVTLERASAEATEAADREHVTRYIYTHADRFSLARVDAERDYSAHRWTVDTPEDLEFVRRIYGAVGDENFSWRDVLDLEMKHPEWAELNRHVQQKPA